MRIRLALFLLFLLGFTSLPSFAATRAPFEASVSHAMPASCAGMDMHACVGLRQDSTCVTARMNSDAEFSFGTRSKRMDCAFSQLSESDWPC